MTARQPAIHSLPYVLPPVAFYPRHIQLSQSPAEIRIGLYHEYMAGTNPGNAAMPAPVYCLNQENIDTNKNEFADRRRENKDESDIR